MIQRLNNLGIRAAEEASAANLARLAAGEVPTGLVVIGGPVESKAREVALTLALPAGVALAEIEDEPCFSAGTNVDGVAVEVIDLQLLSGNEEDLEESVAAAVAQGSPKLVYIIEAGEPVALSAEAEAVAIRVRLDPAAELEAVG